MGEQLVCCYFQDGQWEGIDLGGKSLNYIHDQNKLSRDVNGQSSKPMALLRHKTYRNWRAFEKIVYSHTSFYELPLYETSELRNRFLEVTASTKNQQIL